MKCPGIFDKELVIHLPRNPTDLTNSVCFCVYVCTCIYVYACILVFIFQHVIQRLIYVFTQISDVVSFVTRDLEQTVSVTIQYNLLSREHISFVIVKRCCCREVIDLTVTLILRRLLPLGGVI